MNPGFGTGSYTGRQEEWAVYKYPITSVTFTGTETQVRATGSIYYSSGWKVNYKNGALWEGTATVEGEILNDGISLATTTGSIVTFNWSLHYDYANKDILNVTQQTIPWVAQVNEHQYNILKTAIDNPPTCSLVQAYPDFNSTWSGSTPPILSGSYTAGDAIWYLSKLGFKDVPIITPVLRFTLTSNYAMSLTPFTSNILRFYAKSTLGSLFPIPLNIYGAMLQDTDPDPSTTKGIPWYYGWWKQWPTIDQNGTNLTIQQEYKYGLFPSWVYGTRL